MDDLIAKYAKKKDKDEVGSGLQCRTLVSKFGHPVRSSDRMSELWILSSKFGHPLRSSDTLSKVRTFTCQVKMSLALSFDNLAF